MATVNAAEYATDLDTDVPWAADRPVEVDIKRFSGNYLLWREVVTKDGSRFHRGGRGNPKFRHPTFEQAAAEMHRLLGLFPDSRFTILQEIGRGKMKVVDHG